MVVLFVASEALTLNLNPLGTPIEKILSPLDLAIEIFASLVGTLEVHFKMKMPVPVGYIPLDVPVNLPVK
jgi:hypothetical protein